MLVMCGMGVWVLGGDGHDGFVVLGRVIVCCLLFFFQAEDGIRDRDG